MRRLGPGGVVGSRGLFLSLEFCLGWNLGVVHKEFSVYRFRSLVECRYGENV